MCERAAAAMASNATASPYGDLSKLPHDTKQPDIIASAVVTWLIAAGFVAARFYTRMAIGGARPSGSEWALFAALVRSCYCCSPPAGVGM